MKPLTNTEKLMEVVNFQFNLDEAQLFDFQEVINPVFKLVVGQSKSRVWGR